MSTRAQGPLPLVCLVARVCLLASRTPGIATLETYIVLIYKYFKKKKTKNKKKTVISDQIPVGEAGCFNNQTLGLINNPKF